MFLKFQASDLEFHYQSWETCNARHRQKLAETAQCTQQKMLDLCVLGCLIKSIFSFYEFYGDKTKPGKIKDEIFNNGLKKNGKKNSPSMLISMITLKRSYEGFWRLNNPKFSKLPRLKLIR